MRMLLLLLFAVVGLANERQQQLLSQFGANQMHKQSEYKIQQTDNAKESEVERESERDHNTKKCSNNHYKCSVTVLKHHTTPPAHTYTVTRI